MDFNTALPESDGYTQIWVIVDRLTKMAHFIPLRVSEGSEAPVEDLAKVFAKEVWRLYVTDSVLPDLSLGSTID
jgi:hypothetical protein